MKRDKCHLFLQPIQNEKNVEAHSMLCPHRLKKLGGHVPGFPHLIALMEICISIALFE